MMPRHPRSTRAGTPFPDMTLFRSPLPGLEAAPRTGSAGTHPPCPPPSRLRCGSSGGAYAGEVRRLSLSPVSAGLLLLFVGFAWLTTDASLVALLVAALAVLVMFKIGFEIGRAHV